MYTICYQKNPKLGNFGNFLEFQEKSEFSWLFAICLGNLQNRFILGNIRNPRKSPEFQEKSEIVKTKLIYVKIENIFGS